MKKLLFLSLLTLCAVQLALGAAASKTLTEKTPKTIENFLLMKQQQGEPCTDPDVKNLFDTLKRLSPNLQEEFLMIFDQAKTKDEAIEKTHAFFKKRSQEIAAADATKPKTDD